MSGTDSAVAHSHGKLMDAVYRHQRHVYDLTRKYYLLGRDRLIEELQPTPGDAVLEVGCGTGRNLIQIARRYPETELYGFDISNEMLATAQAQIDKAGLTRRVHLSQGDASSFACTDLFARSTVDRVVYSYTLSMIPDWQAALRRGLQALSPAGSLHAVDFGQNEGLPRPFAALMRRWLAAFHVEARPKLAEALAQTAALQPGRQARSRSLYRGYAWIGTIR